MQDLGCITNVEVISKLIDVTGMSLIDAGCGAMQVSRMLAEMGANVLAIDPDSVQAEKNRTSGLTDSISGLTFQEAGAEKLPAGDQTIDGVFFSYSLHHIPATIYPDVFDEVFRVLKPGGFLYVIEPIGCPLNEVMKLFHDEDAERAAAQAALHEIAFPRFDSATEVTYHGWTEFESFADYAEKFGSRSFNSDYTFANVSHEAVRLAFEKHGAPDYRFQSPKQVTFLAGFNA